MKYTLEMGCLLLSSFSFLAFFLCSSASTAILLAVLAYGFNLSIVFKFFKGFFFIAALFTSFLIGFTTDCTSSELIILAKSAFSIFALGNTYPFFFSLTLSTDP
ncbi:hypothetical protein HanRHA438_Chr09g0403671 [Helianthus annuus]|nr:hypothetical protein HanIR_Chr09g0422801 [Helianthus annuus]KAJ0888590.1 hypothetical protein HanRHA438_Chr09g0403671 [Helianthus annuus]